MTPPLARNRIVRHALRGLSRWASQGLLQPMFRRLGLALISFLLFTLPVGWGNGQAQVISSPQTTGSETASSETASSGTVVRETVPLINQAIYRYSDPSSDQAFAGATNGLESEDLQVIPTVSTATPLIDPLGQLLGCGGQPLPSYGGFSMALYEPNPTDPTGTELGALVQLTPTEAEEQLGNGISAGLAPNLFNRNPFPLTTSGEYNFLLDPSRGQADLGRNYILVIRPPGNSIYPERRIKLTIEETPAGSNAPLSYRAIALDGEPISLDGNNQIEQTSVFVANAETTGINLNSIQFPMVLCPAEPLAMTKTASQATAEPGDTVIYRVTVRNQSEVPLTELSFTDTLPLGLQLIENSVQAEINQQKIAVTTDTEQQQSSSVQNNRPSTVIIRSLESLPPQGVINLLYAARITPDAMRGSGKNSVTVTSRRQDNRFIAQNGPAIHELQIRPGITSDCGILLGRVFDDLNFDGEQQRGEPGIANAVIYLQDGNRVVTDENGLFSVANVLPGSYTGVLDLSSVPGYDFAPNSKRREFRSGSRLVRLAPSSMARMNFPVTLLSEETQL